MNILRIWPIVFVLCVPYKHRKDMLFAFGLKDFGLKEDLNFWGFFQVLFTPPPPQIPLCRRMLGVLALAARHSV
jgi:hypothetical protein